MLHVVIEQTREYENRMEYDPKTNTFVETESKSLFFARNCLYPHICEEEGEGWFGVNTAMEVMERFFGTRSDW